jgi:hypothetical protein
MNILLFGEIGSRSGYARILESLCVILGGMTRVSVVPLVPVDDVSSDRFNHVQILGARSGVPGLQDAIASGTYDVLIAVHDLGISLPLASMLSQRPSGLLTILYSASDHPTIDPGVTSAIARFDVVVLFTELQAASLRTSLSASAGRSRLGIPLISYIAPGLDSEFRDAPLLVADANGRERRRQEIVGDGWADDRLLYLNASRNTIRKRIDLTIDAFAMLAGKTSARIGLLLHMSEFESTGWDVRRLIQQAGISHLCRMTADLPIGWPATTEALVGLYQVSEIGVSTSVADGWGLPSMEHAAVGGAQILPETPHFRTLWGSNAVLVTVSRPRVARVPFAEEYVVAAENLCNRMESLCFDASARTAFASKATSFARSSDFSWETALVRWSELLRSHC